MTLLALTVRCEDWVLRKPLRISRETMNHAAVIVVEVSDGENVGHGEGCPVAYFGESMPSVLLQLQDIKAPLMAGEDWTLLHDQMPAGSARNAVDCAIWDWRAKRSGRRVWQMLGLPQPQSLETVFTISLDRPQAMAEAARAATGHDILKLKLGAPGDLDRLRAVRDAVPNKRLIIDVNEGWSLRELEAALPVAADCRVEMIEQPLPAGRDEELASLKHVIPFAADESCHTMTDLGRVTDLYDVINIKLDKTGGLTEAMRLAQGAQKRGLDLMVGCTLGTSLAMAPGMLVGQLARFVDLDAPLLIGDDRQPALQYDGGIVQPPDPALWG